ncbi:MAG: hypothetical protein NC517_01320 [Firmicutes bacterium]|nr:hypothetical protein [Bacillota bacterium]
MLYHVSSVQGLKVLQPRVSTHGKAYVYAIENKVTGLLFGVKKDDFDFMISTDEAGTPSVYECYPDAFREIYEGKSCSVYQVEETGFQRGMTSWSVELVSEEEVRVLEENVVEDMYRQLLEEEKRGSLRVHRYEYNEEYRRRIASHVVDRMIRFGVDPDKCIEQDERFAVHYRGIARELGRVMDGHLLR